MKLKVYKIEDIKKIARDERYPYTEIEIMKEIVLPKSCFYLFSGFRNVKEIKGLNKLDTSNVDEVSCMFYGCESLTSLDLSSFNTSNVVCMDGMFHSCKSLTALDLSSFDTSKNTTMCAMFKNCKSLTSLNLSGFDTSNVEDAAMGEMFFGCEKLIIKKFQ